MDLIVGCHYSNKYIFTMLCTHEYIKVKILTLDVTHVKIASLTPCTISFGWNIIKFMPFWDNKLILEQYAFT
jgi:hypothetical protein